MASTEVPDPEGVNPAPAAAVISPSSGLDKKTSLVDDPETRSVEDGKQDQQQYGKIDKELAKYVAQNRIHISKERSDQLRKKIDRRVLVIMILTYFLQAIDKGTLSFTSIMGLPEDTGMTDENGDLTQEVRFTLLLHICPFLYNC